MKWAIARPSAASRVSSSAAACAARAGRGPSVPALRYARRASTGNSARSAVQSTNGENTPMPSAGSPGPLWEPSDEQRDSAEMTRFMAWAAQRSGRTLPDYEALRRWSVEQLEDFWAAIWDYAGVRASRPFERVLDSHGMPGARWFEGAQLNYAENLLAGPPTVAHVVTLPYLAAAGDAGAAPSPDGRGTAHAGTGSQGEPARLSWAQLLERGRGAAPAFEQVPFDHPLWVLYSSGTTGLPKAIVQGQGGILLEHLKGLALGLDMKPGDRFFWYTTAGWMMWNLLIGGLLVGATILLYDCSAV